MTGVDFDLSVDVTNTDDEQLIYEGTLYLQQLDFNDPDNPVVIDTRTYESNAAIGAGETVNVTFTARIYEDGMYTLAVGDIEDYVQVGT